MVESASPLLSPQALIAKHRKSYYLVQLGFLGVGILLIVLAAQLFLSRQVVAMVAMAIGFDLARVMLGLWANAPSATSRDDWPSQFSMLSYFWASTPRRWFEYALVSLPANAVLTYLLHAPDFDTMNNAATMFMSFAGDVARLVKSEVSDIKASLASLTVDFGLTGVLEYLAARWLFAKRKLKIKNRT